MDKSFQGKITFETLESKIKNISKKKIVIVCPENEEILQTVKDCLQYFDFILVGKEELIKQIAQTITLSLEKITIINCENPEECTKLSLEKIHNKEGDMIMKGTLSTKDILKVCFKDDIGLRCNKLVTSVSLFELPTNSRLILLSDPGVILRPTLEQKVEQIKYMTDISKSIGINTPKIAVLAAIETVNNKMIETVEADKLSKMNNNGEIKDCIVDGPLSFDIAIDEKASELKYSTARKVSGDADCLLFPDIHSANFIYKAFTHIVNAKAANMVIGTKVPIILTSRSDSAETKKNSILLASYYSEYIKKNLNIVNNN